MESTVPSFPASILPSVQIRLIRPDERERWDNLVRQHHYLGLRSLVGESLRYVAQYQGHWLALLGWSAPALKCRPRDIWIGWPEPLHWQRISLMTNNSRFLILPWVHIPNLASRVLALNVKRLAADWQAVHGHPVLLAETFVDPSRFRGTCYKAAGWFEVGETRGFAKCGQRYRSHGQPKRIFVKPLQPKACLWLADPTPRPEVQLPEVKMMELTEDQADDLLARLRAIPDPRAARGVRHKKTTVLAIAICAIIGGARSFAAIAEWGQRASQNLLRRLNCRRNPTTKCFCAPSEPTIRRVLQSVNAEAVDQALSGWLCSLAGEEEAIAIDGKVIKGARQNGQPVQVLSAFSHQQGVVLGQQTIDSKTNEIPMLPTLLGSLDLNGKVVTADALHTQRETARYLVEKKKADYLFTVKDNQPTLKEDIEALDLPAFPP
jgi:predicted transposase YbfD/YdcC